MELMGFEKYMADKLSELFRVNLVYQHDISALGFSQFEYAIKNFFNLVDKKDFSLQIPKHSPTINFNSDITKFLIDNKLVAEKNVYNKPSVIDELIPLKSRIELLSDNPNFPKTAFDKGVCLEKLKFPIVAKKLDSVGSTGVQKFMRAADLKEDTHTFDIFSEFQPHDEEYSITLFRDDILLFMEKSPLNYKALKLRGSLEEKSEFKYVKHELNHVPVPILKVIESVRKQFPELDVYELKLLKDENNNIILIDLNVNPDFYFDSILNLYYLTYKDFYGKKMSEADQAKLKQFANDLNTKTINNDNIHFFIL